MILMEETLIAIRILGCGGWIKQTFNVYIGMCELQLPGKVIFYILIDNDMAVDVNKISLQLLYPIH